MSGNKGAMGNHHGEAVPDQKMGRYGARTTSAVKKAEKKRANAKRRRRDKSESAT